MCGIVGLAAREPITDNATLTAMRDTMRHRGPDDAGEWWSADHKVGLAQRRLAIIDLSPGGHQPMADVAGELCITFNGEIYNFRELRCELEAKGHAFQTASDTEVILVAYREWGADCLRHLNGMFAFALYDSRTSDLLLARDRAGEKPLFFRQTGDRLIFASELKALMADPAFARRIDREALEMYLAYGYVPGSGCILEDVQKLPAGHACIYNARSGASRVWRYWELPEPHYGAYSSEELGHELECILRDAVRRQMIADVPLGVLLSGGIDSSLITAMAASEASGVVKTFTVSFPGSGSFDEGPYARLVADHFGTDHTELVAEPASVALLPELARQFDEPLADHSIVPTMLLARQVRQHVTVALGGDGGDELFGGYPHYSFIEKASRLRRIFPAAIRSGMARAAEYFMPVGKRGRNHAVGLEGDISNSIAHVNIYFNAHSRARLLAGELRDDRFQRLPERYRAALCVSEQTPLQQATRADFLTTMVDDYLVKVDRASMLSSLEVRAPFLDHRLVEFAYSRVPDNLRATETERKVLLKRLARRLLPPQLDLERKQGFVMPLAQWFSGEWGDYTVEVLKEADQGLFDRRFIDTLVDAQRRGHANTNRLFLLTMFELWRREYKISLPR